MSPSASTATNLPSCHNEFRSDTFTVPTQEMKEAVFASSDGDAVYCEDHDTNALEAKVAKLAGKESGLYCVSGTMSNQVALRTLLTQPPHSVLCDYRAHVYVHEAGGLATLSQAMVRAVIPSNGLYLTLDDVKNNYTPDDGDVHGAPTKVVSLENTIHGIIMPIEEIAKISKWCKENDIKLHLDGARLFNAAAETKIDLKEWCKYFDSVSLCLSKSLGAPIGSVLVGDEKFTVKANHFKKQNGGGIRQSGVLARMASIAIDENYPKLPIVHGYAKDFAKFCESKGIQLDEPPHTNFVFIDGKKSFIDPDVMAAVAKKYNVKATGSRVAFHYQNSPEAIENLKKTILEAFELSKKIPHEKGAPVSKYGSLKSTIIEGFEERKQASTK